MGSFVKLIFANIRLGLSILGIVHETIVVQIHWFENIVNGLLQRLVCVNVAVLLLRFGGFFIMLFVWILNCNGKKCINPIVKNLLWNQPFAPNHLIDTEGTFFVIFIC